MVSLVFSINDLKLQKQVPALRCEVLEVVRLVRWGGAVLIRRVSRGCVLQDCQL